MSAIQWSGGKLHGASEAKVQGFLHDTKDTRLTHGHSNPDIDLSRTPNNMAYRGLTYQQKCERYDELMETVKIKRKSSGANANVTLQKLVICVPEDMQDGDRYDAVQVQSWVNDVGAILEKEFGELLIDIDCHVDEVHQYLNPQKDKDDPNRFIWSRIHLHAAVVPAVWEVVKDKAGNPILDSDGKPVKELVLNAHQFARKAVIVRLNKLVQEMTQQKYDMNFMSGAGKGKKHQTVEDLKRLSAQAMRDEGLATNRALPGPVSPVPPSGPSQDDIGPDPVEYAGRVRRQAEEDAKYITDQAKADAEQISADAKRQADELQQITIQSAMARMAQMRAKLELEVKEREQEMRDQEQALQNARKAIDSERAAINNMKSDLEVMQNKLELEVKEREQEMRDQEQTLQNARKAIDSERTTIGNMKSDLEAMQTKLESEHKKIAIMLEAARADHQQQRKLTQKALSTEAAATKRLIALNEREAALTRQERELRPVSTTYNMLRGVLEHEKKAANRESAKAVRDTMHLLYDAQRAQESWLHETEQEYIRSKKQKRGYEFNFDAVSVSARQPSSIANYSPNI